MRRAKAATTPKAEHCGQPRGQIAGAVSIGQRRAEVEDRAVPGHWEGDLICGARNSHIATLVERRSRFVVLVQVDGKDSATVVDALIGQVRRLPDGPMASLTWDRGMELAHHARLTVATEVAVHFRDPRSPWQRGSPRTPTACCANTSPTGPTCQPTARPTSTRWHSNSTPGPERHSASRRQALSSPKPLRRPVEPTTKKL